MICPNCKAIIADTVKHCPYCNYEIRSETGTHGHTVLGKMSLIFAILTIIFIFMGFLAAISGLSETGLIMIISFLFSIYAIVLGAIAYFGKLKDRYGLIGFILGICFLISIFLVISAATYFQVGMPPAKPSELFPSESSSIYFEQDDVEDTLTVVYVDQNEIKWTDIVIDHSSDGGFDSVIKSGIYVKAGDQIIGCSGVIILEHEPTNMLLGRWKFN